MPVGTPQRPLQTEEPLKIARAVMQEAFTLGSGRKALKEYNGKYYVWEEDRWVPKDKDWLRLRLWRELEDAHVVRREGEPERYRPTPFKVTGVLEAMESLLDDHAVTEMPCWLPWGREGDAPDPRFMVAFRDKVVDVGAFVKTGKMVTVARDERWFGTTVVPCDLQLDPLPECPRWFQALEEWSGGDVKWQELLKRWMGYCLMGYRGYSRWLLLQGKTRAGKGIITRVIRHLMGRDAFMGTTLDDMVGSFGLDGLQKARVLSVSEVSELESVRAEKVVRVLKNIVGEDPISINVKYQRPVNNVVLNCAAMVSANEIPKLPNKARGLSDKMLILPFNHTFLGKEQFDLFEVLKAETAGIALWAMGGAAELMGESDPQKKWPEPLAAQGKMQDFLLSNNPFDHFLQSRFVKRPQGFVRNSTVQGQWFDWVGKNRVRMHVAKNMISKNVCDQSSWPIERRKRGSIRGIVGMSLRVDPDDEA